MKIWTTMVVVLLVFHHAAAQVAGSRSSPIAEVEQLINEGKLSEAEAKLDQINAGDDPFAKAVKETTVGLLNLTKARNDLALEHLQVALSLFRSINKLSTREGAQCLADLSLVYANTGKFNQARENGLVALDIRQQLFAENSEPVAASYNDLGLVYGSSDPDKALEYYERALSVYEKLLGARHPKVAQAKSNIGYAFKKLKLYGDAINNFETAESILKENYPDGHPSLGFAEVNLGLSYLQLNDKKTAIRYLENGLAIFLKTYGKKHSDIASAYNQLGLIRLSDNEYEAALHNFQQAICANMPDYNNEDFESNPKLDQYLNGKVLLYSLRLKAQSLEAFYFGRTLKFDHLRLSLSALHACDTLIDHIRHHSADENDKIELGESANETYEDGVRIAMTMSEMSVHYKNYLQEAFYFSEKSKSAVLQESIADAEAKSFAGIPQPMVEKEKELKAKITLLTQKLALSSGGVADQTRAELNQFNRDYESFIHDLERDYPKYYDLKFNNRLPDIAALQGLLDEQTAIVSFFIAEKGNKLYQFTVSKNHFKVKALSLPPGFDKYLKGFTKSILYGDLGTYRKATEFLRPLLVPSMPASVTSLIIVPSGRLGTIPFEALPEKSHSAIDFASVPYLLNRFAISYEFSAALIVQKSKSGTSPSQSIFLCAPITFDETTRLNQLPGTEAEVKSIAGLFGTLQSSVAVSLDATETIVKSGKLSQYQYLHFATHGTVDEVNPELSRIYLREGAGEDGSLFAGEIYSLDLHADLAVLSACQTGLGKVSKGEGVIGLSRALVYAGAKNIIVSLWSVADQSTSLLMTDFYTLLLKSKHQNFRKTLQQAKQSMIHDKTFAEPYYWAPFVMIGF